MTIKTRILLLILLLLVMVLLVSTVRKKKMELRYVLIWMLGDLFLILIVLFPTFLKFLSGALGISTPANMVFFLGFLVMLGISFYMTILISRLSSQVRTLTQQLALRTGKEQTKAGEVSGGSEETPV